MEIWIGVAALVVAVVSVAVAVWQGRMAKEQGDMAKQQLVLAKDTEGRTERALEEIRDLTRRSDQTLSDLKTNIDDRITKILDQRLESDRASQQQGADFLSMIMQSAAQQQKDK